MPELPEVEGFRKYIAGTSLDQRIHKVHINDAKVVKDPENEFLSRMQGNTIVGTDRVGKYLFLEMKSHGPLMMHFGMTGSPHYYRDAEDAPRHARVVFEFDSGYSLAYNCPRKFGRLILTDDVTSYCAANKIGTDAAKIGWDEFQAKLSNRKSPIKSVLMNQSLLAGVGNWIADEILWQAKIHPEEKAIELSEQDMKEIYGQMEYVLQTALKHDAHFPDFPKEFMIHSRWTDSGRPDAPRIELEKLTIGGRSTYFDPTRQVKRD